CDSARESASSRIGLKFSSRVISDSNMFMAMLRVEMVPEVIWSRPLMLASWPNVKLPPTRGHLKVSAETEVAIAAIPATAQTVERMACRNMLGPPEARSLSLHADWLLLAR